MSQGINNLNIDKSQQFMDFMMKSTESMAILTLGNIALKFLIIFLWEPSLTVFLI